MIIRYGFLSLLLSLYPMFVFGDDGFNIGELTSLISGSKTIADAAITYETAFDTVANSDKYKTGIPADVVTEKRANVTTAINNAKAGRPSTTNPNDSLNTDNKDETKEVVDTRTDEEKAAALAEKKKAYDDAKATEQSTANKTLTAATTAATGMGLMNLATGVSEQRVDSESEQAMDAYIATFRCSYGHGASVKASFDEIELPGGNDEKIMAYRSEYLALAKDLKQRKESLGMKPGIESEEILDKAEMGLYNDETQGITNGQYSSIYRANFLNSEADQTKLATERGESDKKVKNGGLAAAGGALGGIAGDSLINGALGDKVKGLIGGKDGDAGGLADKAKDLLGGDGASNLADKAKELLGGAGGGGNNVSGSENQQ